MFGNWLKTSHPDGGHRRAVRRRRRRIGGANGMLLALVIGGAMNFFAYWFSDKMVLQHVQRAARSTQPRRRSSTRMVQELAQRAGLPMPRVYLIDEAQPNAFATGRNPEHAAVAATTGILQRAVSERELRGVMAHELAHVKHRDILISTVSRDHGRRDLACSANFAHVLRRPRQRRPTAQSDRRHAGDDPGADRGHADPDGDLARARIRGRPRRRRNLAAIRTRSPIALEKIDALRAGHAAWQPAEAHPATAQMMIINPLSGAACRACSAPTRPPRSASRACGRWRETGCLPARRRPSRRARHSPRLLPGVGCGLRSITAALRRSQPRACSLVQIRQSGSSRFAAGDAVAQVRAGRSLSDGARAPSRRRSAGRGGAGPGLRHAARPRPARRPPRGAAAQAGQAGAACAAAAPRCTSCARGRGPAIPRWIRRCARCRASSPPPRASPTRCCATICARRTRWLARCNSEARATPIRSGGSTACAPPGRSSGSRCSTPATCTRR